MQILQASARQHQRRRESRPGKGGDRAARESEEEGRRHSDDGDRARADGADD